MGRIGLFATSQDTLDDQFDKSLVRSVSLSNAITASLHALPPSKERDTLDTYVAAMAVTGISLAHRWILDGKKELPSVSQDANHILESVYINLTAGILDEKSGKVVDPSAYNVEQKEVFKERETFLVKTLIFPTDKMEVQDWIDQNKEAIKKLPYQVINKDDNVEVERTQALTSEEKRIIPIPSLSDGVW